MTTTPARLLPVLSAAVLALSGTALLAHPGNWGPGWGGERYGVSRSGTRAAPSLEGKLDVARFRAEEADPASLAKGAIIVIAMPGDEAESDPRARATFEAAVEGQLVRSGYQALPGGANGGQIAEVRFVRSEAEPAEGKRDPVSGEMTMGVSNRGSMLGLAVHIDGSKPRKALILTRLETRIRDRASGAVLWEGRAQMFTRDGDDKWGDDAIAARLAAALFDCFPLRTGEARERR